MNDENGINKVILYISLGLCGGSMLLTGIFLGQIFALFSVKIPAVVLIMLQIAFIVSAIFNFWLIKFAKDKL